MRVTVTTPASIANFGPGFDVYALATNARYDTITLEDASEELVEVTGVGAATIPVDPTKNCGCIALNYLRERFGFSPAERR